MNLKNLTNYYFDLFKKKKLKELDSFFNKNIELYDSENLIKGKKNVLNFNKKFKAFNLIQIKILYQAFNDKNRISFSYIKVKLGKKSFDIVDLIEFSKNKKIKKIIAFKR